MSGRGYYRGNYVNVYCYCILNYCNFYYSKIRYIYWVGLGFSLCKLMGVLDNLIVFLFK